MLIGLLFIQASPILWVTKLPIEQNVLESYYSTQGAQRNLLMHSEMTIHVTTIEEKWSD